jgi:hypothetical protein
VRIDDLLNEVLEPVCRLFPFPGADEAVTHDPGAIPRAQPAGVLNQLGIGGTEILPPEVSQVLRERLVIKPEAVPEGLVHVIQGDRADAAAPPDVAHALENFSGRQPEPGLPHAVDAEIRGYLEDTAWWSGPPGGVRPRPTIQSPRGSDILRSQRVRERPFGAGFHQIVGRVSAAREGSFCAQGTNCSPSGGDPG